MEKLVGAARIGVLWLLGGFGAYEAGVRLIARPDDPVVSVALLCLLALCVGVIAFGFVGVRVVFFE